MTVHSVAQVEPPLSAARSELLSLLEARRSVALTWLGEPGPSETELRRILTIAARVPDHGALEPWRFIVIAGEARRIASERLAVLYAAENRDMDAGQREKFAAIISRGLTHAPVVIVVVSRTDPNARIPAWEQDLSVGAVCMNLLTAAHAMGFGANWLTGWAAFSAGAGRVLGLSEKEKVAGIIHIGSAKETPSDRKRPDVEALTTKWAADDPASSQGQDSIR